MKEKVNRWIWFNMFFGDFLIGVTVLFLQFITGFRSKSLFFITGMLLVFLIWQLNDYLKWRKWHSQTY